MQHLREAAFAGLIGLRESLDLLAAGAGPHSELVLTLCWPLQALRWSFPAWRPSPGALPGVGEARLCQISSLHSLALKKDNAR